MDATELAVKMLEWGELQQEASTLAAEIEMAVLEIGKTQTVGSVRASYSKGRKSYDYKTAARDVPPSLVRAHTTTIERVDWSGICKDEEITDIPFTQSAPSVAVKLLT